MSDERRIYMTKVAEHLKNTISNVVLDSWYDAKSKQEVICIPADKIRQIVTILKNELFFDMLIDIIAVDWKDRQDNRFELDYLFYNTKENTRVHLKLSISDNAHPTVETISDIHLAADWAERECYDMMGITFEGHRYLQRLLMWDDFEGHALRKDYPLGKRQAIPKTREVL